jgi:hypothetical protein
MAHIMTQKYMNAIPMCRQEDEFAMNGLVLSRQTMAKWMVYCSKHCLALLVLSSSDGRVLFTTSSPAVKDGGLLMGIGV